MRAFPLISVTVMFQGLGTQLGTSRLIIKAVAAELPTACLCATELLPGTPGYLLSQLCSLKLSRPLEESGCLCLTPCTWSYNLPQKKGFLYGRLPFEGQIIFAEIFRSPRSLGSFACSVTAQKYFLLWSPSTVVVH